jgi:malate permease and related proteins
MTKLIELYLPLVGLVLLGLILGRYLSAQVPQLLGQFLFWVGVPVSIVAFLHTADLSGQLWVASALAWIAIFCSAFFAWVWLQWQAYRKKPVANSTKGSLLLLAMFGNTGYLGYPVTLAIVGSQYFAWALFYDLLGTALGAYGLGVALAAYFGGGVHSQWQMVKAIAINPTLWSFGFGLLFRSVAIAPCAESYLKTFAWCIVALSLVLIGMRLSQINSWHSLPLSVVSLSIKMLLVPLILGSILPLLGLKGAIARVIVLQMAMPPAFATLVIAEAYNLDRELAVTAMAVGYAGFLVTLPIWLWLF